MSSFKEPESDIVVNLVFYFKGNLLAMDCNKYEIFGEGKLAFYIFRVRHLCVNQTFFAF